MKKIGIDFGTTNSLVSFILEERCISLTDQKTGRPHPSVVWYRGGDDVIIGREAKENMNPSNMAAPPGFVMSPKTLLKNNSKVEVSGRVIDSIDVVGEVFKHLKADAKVSRGSAQEVDIEKAVVTIPVNFSGAERRALRRAAKKAGIGVVQFVHEPVAALYAYLRNSENFHRDMKRLEGSSILVFDWGGGTLDLTLCRIVGQTIMQIMNLGDNEIGGDIFDYRLRNFVRETHSREYKIDDIRGLEQPGMAAKLLAQCEEVKIDLSEESETEATVFIKNYLKVDSAAQNLICTLTKEDIQRESRDLVERGLGRVDEILELSGLNHKDIGLCLATGGMVNMPSIREGLTERFVGRVPKLDNGDKIISEGAAWIAHDELLLTLSKPIELLVADTSGRGAYYPIVDEGFILPQENQNQLVNNALLYCTDPREGKAFVDVVKPIKVGPIRSNDARKSLCVAKVGVDSLEKPLIERIQCKLEFDHDYVAKLTLTSTGKNETTTKEFYDIEFALTLKSPPNEVNKGEDEDALEDEDDEKTEKRPVYRNDVLSTVSSNMFQRPNIVAPLEGANKSILWKLVPGDLMDLWDKNYFDPRRRFATPRQNEERNFYTPCSSCKRTITEIRLEGRSAICTKTCTVQPL